MEMSEYEYRPIFNCTFSIAACFLLSVVYICSLYVWNFQYDRNHPSTIKRRFLSVFIMMFISPAFLYLALNRNILEKVTLWKIIGFKTQGLLPAVIIPLVLTMVLFLGPLWLNFSNDGIFTNFKLHYWISNIQNLIWLRNHIVAPLSEEFTFRSCMMPILLQNFSPLTAVFVCPLFFGVAHFHHMIERIRQGLDFRTAFLVSCFHFSFTTIFGAYSAYLFWRTGHFISTFIVHSFCNHMGAPDIQELMNNTGKQRIKVLVVFVTGLVMWSILLNPLTEPSLYYNDMQWTKI